MEEAAEAEQETGRRLFFFGVSRIYNGGQQQKLTWDGSWVHSLGLPSAAADASVSTLRHRSASRKCLAFGSAQLSMLQCDDGALQGSYLLDNGDGLNPHGLCPPLQIFRGPSDTVLVVAKGTTEFGPFISAGRLTMRRAIRPETP